MLNGFSLLNLLYGLVEADKIILFFQGRRVVESFHLVPFCYQARPFKKYQTTNRLRPPHSKKAHPSFGTGFSRDAHLKDPLHVANLL